MIRTLTLSALAVALATTAQAQNSSTVPLGDEYFAMKAYSEGLAEIAKSELAVEKATEPGIKEFAEKMVKSHTEVNAKLAALARSKSIPLPRAVDGIHSVAIARMAKMSGSDFDKAYLMAQIGGPRRCASTLRQGVAQGKDSELKELAHQTMPALWAHTKAAFELSGEKREYEKLQKVHEYARQVMTEK